MIGRATKKTTMPARITTGFRMPARRATRPIRSARRKTRPPNCVTAVAIAKTRMAPRTSMRRPNISILERILHQDRVVALGRGREQRHRATDELLEIFHIFDRLGGEIGPGAPAGRRFLPAFEGLIDRDDILLRFL